MVCAFLKAGLPTGAQDPQRPRRPHVHHMSAGLGSYRPTPSYATFLNYRFPLKGLG